MKNFIKISAIFLISIFSVQKMDAQRIQKVNGKNIVNPYYSRTDTKILKIPESTWKKVLNANLYSVSRLNNTEMAFTGKYNDFVMINGDDEEAKAGICHNKEGNSDLPPQWLIYVNVENLDESIDACKKNGGKIIGEKRKMGEDGRNYVLIQDPAGAHMMICG